MFKTALIASTADISTAANINGDFMSGFQNGVRLSNEADFSCPAPEASDKVNNAMNMFKMAKNMMGGQKAHKKGDELEEKDNQDKFFETVDMYAEQLAVVASVMDDEYEGGDFCAGLTIGFEGRTVIKGKAMTFAKNMFMH